MKRTRHTPEQIVSKLREAEAMLAAGRPVAQVVQSLGVSEQTFNRWRNQYGGMKADEARRLKELEIENARLEKINHERGMLCPQQPQRWRRAKICEQLVKAHGRCPIAPVSTELE